MKLKLYTLFLFAIIPDAALMAQPCTSLTATVESFESRCASTGKLIITALNGSGTYNYSVTGPVTTPFTSDSIINGLPAGAYTVNIRDVINDCIYTLPLPVIVEGDYRDPRFELFKTNVTCLNGTDGSIRVDSVLYGREPFSYAIVAPSSSAVGTTSNTGLFTGLPAGNYFIQQRDSCGGIQTRNITILNYDWFIDPYSVTRVECDSADVFIGLKDIFGNTNTIDSVFNGFIYGIVTPDGDTILSSAYSLRLKLGDFRSLHIFVTDKCGNTKRVNWVDTNIPRVANAVAITNQTCFDFSASITGQLNLTNPQYCLYDSTDILISCNTTGEFPNLSWGSYCIKVTDVCYDTVITRCFTAVKPVPSVAANVTITYGDDCRIVTVSVTGQTNLFNPVFCLYDSSDVLITCNTDGIFGNIPVGKYCMRITGSVCNDTTLIRCFEVVPLPVGPGSDPEFSNYNCSTFTGSISGTVGLGNATYCLYDSIGQLMKCNNTGVFDSLAYGSYCISIEVSIAGGGCADTTFSRCFTVTRPIPVIGPLTITKTCNSFNVEAKSYENFTNPEFCIYNNNVLIACNTTGVFNNLPFGDYCLNVKDSCTDSTFIRCFTVVPDTLLITGNATPSCSFDKTKITGSIITGFAPFTVTLYDTLGNILSVINTSNTNFLFDTLSNLPLGAQYKIGISDSCGNYAELLTAPVISVMSSSRKITPNCPGGTFANGSSDIELTLTSNLGKLIPRIIKKNGVNVTINYTFSNTAQTVFTFKNMEPATYIIRKRISNNCSITLFDTISVLPYAYPALQNSSLYRCDDNSFNIRAVTAGGITPYQYEITGSTPGSPSIISAVPQNSPDFVINNGTAYSLVRLRVTDGCGNASINDISTVPLINFVVNSNGGCIDSSVTLFVDSIGGANYQWFKRILPNDSVLISTSPSYYLPQITMADTGLYFCRVVLNSGCITRVARYYVDGLCGGLLSDDNISLNVRRNEKQVFVNWKAANEHGIKEFEAEVKKAGFNSFRHLAKVKANNSGQYAVTDLLPGKGVNQYRVKVIYESGKISYSTIASVNYKEPGEGLIVFPNPATDVLQLRWKENVQGNYTFRLFDLNNKLMYETTMYAERQLRLMRPKHLPPGMYLLHVTAINTKEQQVVKIIFQ
jgi:Secretion system C-terminal sorting domain